MYKIFPVLLLFVACKHPQLKKHIVGFTNVAVAQHINYDSCKKEIIGIKQNCLRQWNGSNTTERKQFFSDAVVKTIIPAWYGTKWDFNGTTQTPKQGAIACGYFVTTVLQHAGLPIQRVKMAQCASEQMIKTVIGSSKYITRFGKNDHTAFLQYLEQNSNGLYLIGLDNHTGFIVKDSSGIWFIHSSYVGTGTVQKDDAKTSALLKQSKYTVLGSLSNSEHVINNWINN